MILWEVVLTISVVLLFCSIAAWMIVCWSRDFDKSFQSLMQTPTYVICPAERLRYIIKKKKIIPGPSPLGFFSFYESLPEYFDTLEAAEKQVLHYTQSTDGKS